MNESSRQKTLSISHWLQRATAELNGVGIGSARLDAEIILAHTLRRPRTFLHAHGDDCIESRLLEIADARIDLRLSRVPIAYIIGHKEFYGRRFKVTSATLVPRPETEVMIDLLKQIIPTNLPLLPNKLRLVDIGTGSGVLGITAKLEHPELVVALCDSSTYALAVAERNASALSAEVVCIRSDLLANYPFQPDIILANLPYVDIEWDTPPELNAEPPEALYAAKHGLALIEKFIVQAASRLTPRGYMLLEADERQHASIIQTAAEYDFSLLKTQELILCFQKSS
jgi:release factor glutamine methyltransferase